jgi:glycosyltransferase involved in cell wall biosynthesis
VPIRVWHALRAPRWAREYASRIVHELRTTVVIPALDEEDSLPLVIGGLRAADVPVAEIVVVDNGSRDRTAEVARRAGATVLHEPRRGYGSACLRALEHVESRLACGDAAERADPVIVFLDADHSDYPEDLGSLLDPIARDEADFVVGSRLVLREARAAVPLPSQVGNAIATAVMRWRYGVHFTDLGPFRAIRHGALRRLRMRDRTWGWTVEMQLRACQERLRMREVPVRYRLRSAGRSKISGSLVGAARAAVKILVVLGRLAWRGVPPSRFELPAQ